MDLCLIKLLKTRLLPLIILLALILIAFSLKKLYKTFLSLIFVLFLSSTLFLPMLVIMTLFLRLWVSVITILLLVLLVASLVSRNQPNPLNRSRGGIYSF